MSTAPTIPQTPVVTPAEVPSSKQAHDGDAPGRIMDDPHPTFQQHHPGARRETSRRTTTPCGTVTAPPPTGPPAATTVPVPGSAAGPARPANTGAGEPGDIAALRGATNLLMKVVSTSSFAPPMMSRHGHRRLPRVASPCLLAVPTPLATGITHSEATASRRSAAGPAPAQPGSHATPQARSAASQSRPSGRVHPYCSPLLLRIGYAKGAISGR